MVEGVTQLEGEVAQKPEELWHVLVQQLVVLFYAALTGDQDVFAQGTY